MSVEVQSLCSTIVHLESQRQRSASSGAEDEACLQLITRLVFGHLGQESNILSVRHAAATSFASHVKTICAVP